MKNSNCKKQFYYLMTNFMLMDEYEKNKTE